MRIITIFENGGDWATAAEHNGVKYKTAYGWIRRGMVENRNRGGRRESVCKILSAHVDQMLTWLSENCTLTLKELVEKLRQQYNIICSQQTVSNHLDGRMFTVKKVHLQPAGTNEPQNKRKRQEYVERILDKVAQNKTVIFIDETNVNLFCKRMCGRAARGRRATRKDPNSRGANLHIIGAIGNAGLIYWERKRGSYKGDNACDWLRTMLNACFARNLFDIVIICDNAPCHSRLESVMEEPVYNDVELLRLSPYSPMLNPIESIWSSVKASIKTTLAENQAEMLNGDPQNQLSATEFRMRFMERAVDNAMQQVTPNQCMRCMNHVQTFYARAIAQQDMPAGE